MDIIQAILPYVGTAIATLIGNFFITKASHKKQMAEAKDAEWQIWKQQLDVASEKLRKANEANDNIMVKWKELSKLHEESVIDSAEKAQIIANQKIELSNKNILIEDITKKSEKYKKENKELLKALEELPKLKKEIDKLNERIKTLERANVCSNEDCNIRKK